MDREIISCPVCFQKLRVPVGHSLLWVTCRVCHSSWHWPNPDHLGERRSLRFRCAIFDRHFDVVIGRMRVGDCYRILSVIGKSPPPLKTDSRPPPNPVVYAMEKARQLLKGTACNRARVSDIPVTGPLDIDGDDLDFDGWYCPCCQHGKGREAEILFVRCNKCLQLVCGGRTTRVDGETWFRCHDRCGDYGRVQGNLESFQVTDVSRSIRDARKPPLLRNRDPTTAFAVQDAKKSDGELALPQISPTPVEITGPELEGDSDNFDLLLPP